MKISSKKINLKNRFDLISRILIFTFATFGILILLLMFFMILQEAFPAYKEFGFFHMYFSADFSYQGGYGIWGGLAITLITSILAVLIATPLSVRTAIFMKYRLRFMNRFFKIIINILAGVPSVIFGIFALKSLTHFSALFGFTIPTSIFNGTITLTIMIFPTMVSMIYNQLSLVNSDLVKSSMALGNTKTYSIYKIVRKDIQSGLIVAGITGLGRAIGETMALSIILTTGPLSNPLAGGLGDFFNSSSASLGVMIARLMFTDSSDPTIRSALFAAGIALFITVMFLIIGANKLAKRKQIKKQSPLTTLRNFQKSKYPAQTIYYLALVWYIFTLPWRLLGYYLFLFWDYLILTIRFLANSLAKHINQWLSGKQKRANQAIFIQHAQKPYNRSGDWIRIALEIFSVFLIMGSIFWIVFDVFIVGIPQWDANMWKWTYVEQTGLGTAIKKGVILNTMLFTLVLIIFSVGLAIPLALATALYLSEYARNKKSGNVIKFFLDSLGGTPSIIFGIFGVVLFRQYLNLGRGGFSLLAGALTMLIVILPSFTRIIEQVLIKVPDALREASYGLGASKFETIRKVILPEAFPGITSGIVLSAGRVIAETAPVYLTIGMLGNVNIELNGQGWTMTTKILYNQIYDSINTQSANLLESYAIAAATLILVGMIILGAEIMPWLTKKKLIRKGWKKAMQATKKLSKKKTRINKKVLNG